MSSERVVDVLLDTNILAELLAQYFSDNEYSKGYIEVKGSLHKELVRVMNKIIKWHLQFDVDETKNEDAFPGFIVASTLAFVEIARRFDIIVGARFSIDQLASFIEQPPEWFIVSSIDNTILPFLLQLPSEVLMSNGSIKPLELADALHIATAMSRGESCYIATTDNSLKQIDLIKKRII